MGSSSSKSTTNQKYETKNVNVNETNVLDKSVNNFVANTVSSQAAACSASISQLQTVDLSNMKIEGDLVSNPNPNKIPEKITYFNNLLRAP